VQFKWDLNSTLTRDIYTWNWHDLHVIYVQNMQKWHIFNSIVTIQTSIENWLKKRVNVRERLHEYSEKIEE